MTRFSEAALLVVLTATCTSVGVALMATTLLIRCLYARWRTTQGVHVLQDGAHRLRWHTRTDRHEQPWP